MRRLLGILVATLLLLAGCGDERPTVAEPEPSPTEEPTTTAPSEPSPTSTPDAPSPESPGTASALGEVIPDDFPLLSGYPEDREAEPGEGRHGPNRTMKPVVPEACGDRVRLPDHADRLRAGWSNPEDYRERQLVAFADVASAQAYAEQVLDLFRSCPEEAGPADTGEARRVIVVDSDLGDFAGAASVQYLLHDSPTPGLTTWHVVRVGASVLLSVTSNEGGAGPDPDQQAADHRRSDARAITGVVKAMADLT